MTDATLTDAEKRGLRASIGHNSAACEDWPCVTCEGVFEEAARLLTVRHSAPDDDDGVQRREMFERLRSAFDPGVLDCGRVGLPCTIVVPVDRWCSCCRVRQALVELRAVL